MNAAEIIRALSGRNGMARCPAHQDRNPSLSIRDGESGLLVTCYAGCDRRDVIAALRQRGLWPGRDDSRPVQKPRSRSSKIEPRTSLSEWARELWNGCRTIEPDDPAGRYLAARGCAMPHPAGDLRWHPRLSHPNGHVGPALVALITGVRDAGRWMSLHRTWIADDGSGLKAFDHLPKDERPKARLLLKGHPKAGGVIRLWPDDEVTFGLTVSEGLENGLTAARVFTPVWAAIDAGNLGSLPCLYPLDSLTVVVDRDRAGIEAFEALARRWHEDSARYRDHADMMKNCEVWRVWSPVPGEDFNDWAARFDDARDR
ncbi:MAG: toprim domain-containing protein [Rhodospirillales bacterium]|nr:toprim domain-containing protein [Rhodospirillales bacterium]